MARCPYCNTEYTPGEIYCKQCNEDLSALDLQPAATAPEPVAILDLFGNTAADSAPPAAVATKSSEESVRAEPINVLDIPDVPQLPIGLVTPVARDHRPEDSRENGSSKNDQVPMQPMGPVCPSCGMTNEKDSKFCDGCGKPLAGNCPSCQKANRLGAKFCQHCGNSLEGSIPVAGVTTPVSVAPQVNKAAATKAYALVLLSKEGRELARFPLREGVNQVGAKSTGEGIIPEIDLGALDTDQVISRRHAVLRVASDHVTIADCGSTNGTRVDGTKIGTTEVHVDEGSSILFGNLHSKLICI